MSSREKFIVGLAAVALLYGLWSLLGSGPETVDEPVGSKSAATIAMVQEVLKDEPGDEKAVARVIANAQMPWLNNAFLLAGFVPEKRVGRDDLDEIQAEAKGIVYSGYLEMGGERIAILNNTEYRAGESVEGFLVHEISPAKISLSRNNQKYEIVLQESK